MQVLEKILEEIKEAAFQADAPIYLGDVEVDRYVQESVVKEIIRFHMDDAKDTNVTSKCSECSRRKWYQKGYEDGKKDICNDNGWIPVEERLPEESLNSVIGWDEHRERCVFVQFWNGRWIFGNDIEPVLITAWRPLPKPYKPKESISAAENIL